MVLCYMHAAQFYEHYKKAHAPRVLQNIRRDNTNLVNSEQSPHSTDCPPGSLPRRSVPGVAAQYHLGLWTERGFEARPPHPAHPGLAGRLDGRRRS